MPVIVFASPKGGVGKSTCASVLATELAARGVQVAIIDADPNRPLVRWAALKDLPDGITLIGDATEDTVIDLIDTESERVPFTIVDLEGSASRMTSFAMSRADLVLIPCKGSDLDAVQAAAAVREVHRVGKACRRSIPFAVVFTQTSAAIETRTLKAIARDLASNGVPILDVRLHERDAFRAMHSFGGGLRGLDPKEVRNIASAIANAEAFTSEVIARLRAQRELAA